MLVGAGLMFVLMHGEVSAEDREIIDIPDIPDAENCTQYYVGTSIDTKTTTNNPRHHSSGMVKYCKIKDLTCVLSFESISCVRGSMF
jgi:hypothetical protein